MSRLELLAPVAESLRVLAVMFDGGRRVLDVKDTGPLVDALLDAHEAIDAALDALIEYDPPVDVAAVAADLARDWDQMAMVLS